MKNIFMNVCSIFLSPVSASQVRPKLCVDCKFYIKNFLTFSKFGNCSKFPTEESNNYYLVNGKNYNIEDYYHYCCTSRKFDNMCGKEGKFFEKKN
jgi:hypothetical protein